MKLKTCYYCGTKYSEEENRCPLCGQTEVEADTVEETTAAATAAPVDDDDDDEMEYEMKNKKSYAKSERKQNIVSAIVCVVLALVVVAGIIFILHSVGVFGDKNPTKDPSLNLPVDDPGKTVLCTGLEIAPASMSFNAKDATANITATVQPTDCTEKVTYASSNEAVATVSAEGVVTAVAEGSASITVTCGSQVKTVAVICSFDSVTPSVPDSVDISKLTISNPDFTLFTVGESTKVSVKGLPEGVDVKIEWETGNPDVATVADGKITAVGKGTTKVYAIINGTKGPECIVRCSIKDTGSEPPVDADGPKLSHTDVTLFKAGEVFTIKLSKDNVKYAGVVWATSDASICTVSETGVVTAVGSGTAKVTGTYEGKTYTCIVRCK